MTRMLLYNSLLRFISYLVNSSLMYTLHLRESIDTALGILYSRVGKGYMNESLSYAICEEGQLLLGTREATATT